MKNFDERLFYEKLDFSSVSNFWQYVIPVKAEIQNLL